jgi:hypothetical protein
VALQSQFERVGLVDDVNEAVFELYEGQGPNDDSEEIPMVDPDSIMLTDTDVSVESARVSPREGAAAHRQRRVMYE